MSNVHSSFFKQVLHVVTTVL